MRQHPPILNTLFERNSMISKSYLSPLCSCIICRIISSSNGIHTHFYRSHTNKKFSSGNNGSYNLLSERAKENAIISEIKYLKEPKKCILCYNIIPFKSKNNKFCSRSCAAKFTNKTRNRKPTKKGQIPWNKGKLGIQFSKISFCQMCNSLIRNSTRITCSKECLIACQSKKASENKNCGGKRNSHRINYIDSFGNPVVLESSYELILANILDKEHILWNRPQHLLWTDKIGGTHRYHPDFYLPEYNLYLDPKNVYLISKDIFKIEKVSSDNNIKVFVVSKSNLNPIWIKSLLEPVGFEPTTYCLQSNCSPN